MLCCLRKDHRILELEQFTPLILQMRKLEPREVKCLPVVTQLAANQEPVHSFI